jgi:hypothetical protein
MAVGADAYRGSISHLGRIRLVPFGLSIVAAGSENLRNGARVRAVVLP